MFPINKDLIPGHIRELIMQNPTNYIIVCPTNADACRLASSLSFFLNKKYTCGCLMGYDTRLFSTEPVDYVIVNSRASTLGRIACSNDSVTIVTTPVGFVTKTLPRNILQSVCIFVQCGLGLTSATTRDKLVSLGFISNDVVCAPFEFAFRGNILDVGVDSTKGVRIVFDEVGVEELKWFDYELQHSIEGSLMQGWLFHPRSEILLTRDAHEDIIDRAVKMGLDLDLPELKFLNYMIDLEARLNYLPIFYPQTESILDYIGKSGGIVFLENTKREVLSILESSKNLECKTKGLSLSNEVLLLDKDDMSRYKVYEL